MALQSPTTVFLVFTALALVAFAFMGDGLLYLAKALAFSTACAILVTAIYPHLRGVRRGDRVSIMGRGVQFPFVFRTGVALSDGALNKEIRVRLEDGREAVGVVESYDSLLPPMPPKVRIMYEEKQGY